MSDAGSPASGPSGNAGGSENKDRFDSLRRILAEQSHLFACGGDIPIREPDSPAKAGSQTEQRESDPVTIRWDLDGTGDDPACAKLGLPPVRGAGAGLDRLLRHSQPATFGRDGQDVYDESYRKALQMDPAAFCTTFDPYSVGIIDAVAQVLLPSVSDSTTHRCVRAELYKLNSCQDILWALWKVQAARRHSASSSQFGSLVVCLPVAHDGGQLQVRHKGQEMTFDWSTAQGNDDPPAIRWAAFYSDCEHEVLEVTSGHRLTLTYNLHAVRGAGRLTGVSPTLDPAHLPLFRELKELLSQDPFDGQGKRLSYPSGVLGFWCSHAYAYNHTEEAPLPDALKGVDAVLWECLQALGLKASIAPVIKMEDRVRDELSYLYEHPGSPQFPLSKRLRKELPSTMPSEWIFGCKFGVHVDRSGFQAETLEEYHGIYRRWGYYTRKQVHWLTTPKKSELQLVYTAYGNQATAGAAYSNCAMLVRFSRAHKKATAT